MVPVVEALVRRHPTLLISVDTVKAAVARAALDAGAAAINDVSALRLDPAMAATVAAGEGGPGPDALPGRHPRDRVVHARDLRATSSAEVVAELRAAARPGRRCGRARPTPSSIDPGFGFSKTVEQNLVLFDQLAALQALGRPVLVGPSRKRFLGAVTGQPVEARDRATAAACALAWERGARLFRVHDVAAARDALAFAAALGGP